MPSRQLDFPVFDADNHMYETTEALTKHLPDSHRGLIDYIDHHGRTKILVRGQISNYIPNPTFKRVGSPGAQEEYFKHGNPEGKSRREIMKPIDALPGFFAPGPRLELMDELGLDYAMMYPTLASLVEERFRDAPDECHIVIHALNQWMLEHWTFNFEGRIFPVPIVTLPIVDKAIAELEWCAERGARAVLIRPAAPPGLRGPRSFALPEFDPFWERVVELDVLVAMHASDSGYTRFTNEWEGVTGEMTAFTQSLFQMAVPHNRAIEDAVTSWVAHGALTRHPKLKVAIIENGSSWVRPLLAHLEQCYERFPQNWEEHPVEVIKRNIWIHPFHEDDPVGLVEAVGVDNVVFGSDYPHVEGMADPISFVDQLEGLSDEHVRQVMGTNMARLMKVA